MKKPLSLFAIIALAGVLAACGSDEPEPPVVEQEQSAEPAPSQPQAARERQRRPEPDSLPPPDSDRAVPRLAGQLDEDQAGYGMTMIIDATDTQAFHDSLRLIAEETSSAQYRALDSSIHYIQLYSPQVMNSTERLHGLLHGRTGEEILEMAEELQRQRGRR